MQYVLWWLYMPFGLPLVEWCPTVHNQYVWVALNSHCEKATDKSLLFFTFTYSMFSTCVLGAIDHSYYSTFVPAPFIYTKKSQTIISLLVLLVKLQKRREREKESFYLQDFGLLNTRACVILLFNKTVNFSQIYCN